MEELGNLIGAVIETIILFAISAGIVSVGVWVAQ